MSTINFIEKEQIGILSLNRPEKRNALNPELVNEFKIKLKGIRNNEKVKVLIITGEGSSFCAGADLEYLNKIKNFSLADNEKDSRDLAELFLMIYHFQKPTIAAVNGPAIAGGCGLASVCDFLVADEQNSKFGYTEVKIGFLASIVSIFLIKRVGYHKAKQLLISGLIIKPEEAMRIGLVDYLSNNVMEDSISLGEKIKTNSALSMSTTKKMISDISNMDVDEAVEYCINLNALSRSTADFAEGLNNFLSKKK
jgi:methylglutaconyl-CoA hydratase